MRDAADTIQDREPLPPFAVESAAAMLDGLGAIAWQSDLAMTRFESVHGAVEALLGYPVSRWLEASFWSSVMHPEDRERLEAIGRRAIELNEGHECECRVLHADGTPRWVMDRVKVVRDPVGRPLGRRGLLIDVTHLRGRPAGDDRAAREAIEWRTRLERVLETTAGFMFELVIDTRVLTWDGVRSTVFGYAPEAIGTLDAWTDKVSPEDLALVLAELRDAVSSERPVSVHHYRVRHADGGMRRVESHGHVQWRDGKPWRCLGFVFDITERGLLQERLSLHEQVLDTIADGVTMAREDGTLLWVNKAIEKMFGRTREEMLGRPTYQFSGLTNEQHARLRDYVQGEVFRHGVWYGETLERRRDGRPLRVRRSMALLHNGSERLWVGTRLDVTEMRELELEVLEAAELEQQRLAQMLHEGLGQDLTGAALLATTLAHQATQAASPLADAATRLSGSLSAAVARCRTLAQNVRGFVLASGGLDVGLRSLALQCEAEYGIECVVRVDPEFAEQLPPERTQLLYRTVVEAVRAAVEDGGPTRLVLSISAAETRGVFRLADDGRGAYPEQRRRRVGYLARALFGVVTVSGGIDEDRLLECSFPILL